MVNPFPVLSDLQHLTEQSSLDSHSLLSCSTCSKCLLRTSIDFTPFVPPSLLKTRSTFSLSSYDLFMLLSPPSSQSSGLILASVSATSLHLLQLLSVGPRVSTFLFSPEVDT